MNKNHADQPSAARRSRGAEPSLRSRQAASRPVSGSVFQKKPACACGGGCPRCLASAPARAKLAVSEPGDRYEQHAQRVARQVMQAPAGESVRGEPVQARSEARAAPASAPVAARPAGLDGGHPLESGLRNFFEPRFGRDLSQVRIHTDAQAARAADRLDANAFTAGRDIVFGAGRYRPDSTEGRRLLAHELAHVAQQESGAPPMIMRDDKGPAFPKKGVKIIGKDADAVVKVLADCSGLGLKLDADKILTITSKKEKKGAGISAAARNQVLAMADAPTYGVIIDTDSRDPYVGQFSEEHPGYQQLDMGDVSALASAGGEGLGATACDLVVHEISEAFVGRGASLGGQIPEGKKKYYDYSHGKGKDIEAKVRKELGRPPRTEKGSFGFLGLEGADNTLWLVADVYSDGKKTVTQLSVARGALGPEKDGTRNVGAFDIVVTAVLKGEVSFNKDDREEVVKTLNKYAKELGVEPIKLPEKKPPEKKPPEKKK